MNKSELVSKIAELAEVKSKDAEKCLNAFIETVSNSLKSGEEVSLVGFGNFKVATRNARTGRNPRTGETISIPEAKVPKFTPGKALKEAVK